MTEELLILIVTHFVSDWLFQPGKWAVEKAKNVKYRFFHSVQYIVLFVPVLCLLNINLLWLSWIFLTHFVLDDYKLVNWWNRNIKREKSKISWLIMVEDQILHILALIPLILKIPLSIF
jgi:ABC-type phosphate transport system permease subunit